MSERGWLGGWVAGSVSSFDCQGRTNLSPPPSDPNKITHLLITHALTVSLLFRVVVAVVAVVVVVVVRGGHEVLNL